MSGGFTADEGLVVGATFTIDELASGEIELDGVDDTVPGGVDDTVPGGVDDTVLDGVDDTEEEGEDVPVGDALGQRIVDKESDSA